MRPARREMIYQLEKERKFLKSVVESLCRNCAEEKTVTGKLLRRRIMHENRFYMQYKRITGMIRYLKAEDRLRMLGGMTEMAIATLEDFQGLANEDE